MRIDSFQTANLLGPAELRPPAVAPPAAPGAGAASAPAPAGQSFGTVLGQELNRVNEALVDADRQAQLVATGDAGNLHEAMVAMAEADLALQITLRVTQKAIAAYQEISRMQI
jgi:flagellar hook-basal body complex protein FliE